jgi:hypothetical protein
MRDAAVIAPSPRRERRRGATVLALAIIALAFQIASLSRPIFNVYDEGIVVFGAQRVLDGDVPYRDFWGMYAPAQFYALAALFWLFSPSLLVAQLWDVAIRAAIAAMVYLWARRLEAGAWSFAAWLVTLLVLAGTGFHGFPIFPALLCGLISGYLVLGAVAHVPERPGPAWRVVAAGAFAGLAALFRHDIGFYLVLAEAIVLATWIADPAAAPWRDGVGRLARALLPLALGVLLIAGPALAYLLAEVPLRDLAFNLFVVPATIYPKVRALAFPTPPDPFALLSGAMTLPQFGESFGVYLPLLAGGAALAGLALTRDGAAHNARDALWRLGLLLLALVTLLMYMKGIVRVSALHVVQSAIPAILLAFVLLARMSRLSSRLRLVAVALGFALAFAIAAVPGRVAFATAADNFATLRALRNETGLRLGLARLCAPPSGLTRVRCFLPRQEDIAMATAIQRRTAPSEPIYVGTVRHDRIFINNIMLYFLAARPSVTKWHELHPGIQTSAPIQAQMIEEFKARDLRIVVLNGEWDAVREPNASALSSEVTLLDDHIRANFSEVMRIGAASLWQRR